MKQIRGYENAKVLSGGVPQLPKGGYIAQILDCKEESKNGHTWLAISFDIYEGEYKDHFKEQYKANINENKKWRGTYNAFIPDESSPYYEDNLNRFKTMIVNIEESNDGFRWDWDESKLKGKLIGVVFREKEFETSEGDVIIITECSSIRSVESIRSGKFRVPNLKALNNESRPVQAATFAVVEDDDCPF